jgi:hypothetical protein
MVKVKQKAGQRVGYAKTAADQKHQKPVLCVYLEMPACTYLPFSVLSFG